MVDLADGLPELEKECPVCKSMMVAGDSVCGKVFYSCTECDYEEDNMEVFEHEKNR